MSTNRIQLSNQLLNVSLQHHQAGRLAEAAAGYQKILQQNPQHSDALHLMGVVAQQMGQYEMAIELIKSAIAQKSSIAHYHHNLGNTYLQVKRYAEAVECYRQAILLKPDYFEAHNGMGTALAELNMIDIAADAYRNVIELKPRFADAHYNLGRMLMKQEKFDEAIACYRKAIRLDDQRADFHFNLGGALLKQEKNEEAVDSYRSALLLQPNDAEALCNMGIAYTALEKKQEAEAAFRQAIAVKADYAPAYLHLATLASVEHDAKEARAYYEQALHLDPDLSAAWYGLGNLHLQDRDFSQAKVLYQKALEQKPDFPECLNNVGQILVEEKCFEEAIPLYERAIGLRPEFAQAYCNLGVAWMNLGKMEQTESALNRALDLKPDLLEARYNLGNMYRDQNRMTEAMECYRQVLAATTKDSSTGENSPLFFRATNNLALSLEETGQTSKALELIREGIQAQPDNALLHANLAMLLLRDGQYTEGWQEWEWRWKMADFTTKSREFGRPLWKGEPLNGAKILIHTEQGYGDFLQFARYIPMVIERGGKVILETPRRLVRLFQSVPGIHQIATTGDQVHEFDWQCPLMSLPLAFGTTIDTVPGIASYVSVPQEEVAKAKEQWPGEGLRVGLAWAGNAKNILDRYRSMKLQDFCSLGQVPNVSFYSLQMGAETLQIREVAAEIQVADACSDHKDFADTAALVAGLDLVITIDTSIAHLAGSLGIPVWVLLSNNRSDWRWLHNRQDSPWYPSARLFRQPNPDDWKGLIEIVKEELRKLAEDGNRK